MTKRLFVFIMFIPVVLAQTIIQVPFCVLRWLVTGKGFGKIWIEYLLDLIEVEDI